MNITEFKVEMLRNKFNRTKLAEELNISKSALSKKINGVNEFSRKDISICKKVLNLTPQRVDEIFFNSNVDLKSTNSIQT
ncbi:helix-turn-helix domain-containing protein [Clostridium beijerinckii]|uniref:helix-turn-helix domain-containing protein n=1 Tax=Clostridium beijerinckii TaxID=1520 RepID=UPI00136196B1|nr:helix-turn-helix transcriptional regulator [Clostridium beijerinckii]MZK53915.1 helix-turn-helix domain-containing protein [Clostridium beijerinckii]MZK62027.1 helix-turn-helix domain-containing protein [Clostridium beijerinckii]MZK72220.1 helix-turn-helix domain-containing protein [Clostridium beijerinckii]MZK77639.1 helix-turn-helix domain-containing protein [Clostridium beijerinckii]MZK87191.1 helix-turn-helix domain-containing protein [Clostridium beijerinckii]